MKKFIEEFKKFALKGNVMDLAIGVIIGAAFQNIVSALTNDFITPLIAAITGKTDENGGVKNAHIATERSTSKQRNVCIVHPTSLIVHSCKI